MKSCLVLFFFLLYCIMDKELWTLSKYLVCNKSMKSVWNDYWWGRIGVLGFGTYVELKAKDLENYIWNWSIFLMIIIVLQTEIEISADNKNIWFVMWSDDWLLNIDLSFIYNLLNKLLLCFTEHILKALSSLQSTEEKLAALCKKYADLHEEHRVLQSSYKQNQRKLTVVSKFYSSWCYRFNLWAY